MTVAGEVLVSLDGVFDQRAVDRITEALACMRPGGVLHIDLTQIREFHDAGLAALARSLNASGRAVRVVLGGLRQHQVRILGYLGVDVDALAALPHGMPA
jgi:ABC-type transporter Mla MlaB component